MRHSVISQIFNRPLALRVTAILLTSCMVTACGQCAVAVSFSKLMSADDTKLAEASVAGLLNCLENLKTGQIDIRDHIVQQVTGEIDKEKHEIRAVTGGRGYELATTASCLFDIPNGCLRFDRTWSRGTPDGKKLSLSHFVRTPKESIHYEQNSSAILLAAPDHETAIYVRPFDVRLLPIV